MALTSDQQAAIDRHLRAHLHETKWLRQEEFVAELTDHYTDSIQARMQQGETFECALARVYDDFG